MVQAPGGAFGGYALSEPTPVEPGHRYHYVFELPEKHELTIFAEPKFYDEDGWLLNNGKTVRGESQRVDPDSSGLKSRPGGFTVPDGARFVRMLYTCNSRSKAGVIPFKVSGCTFTDKGLVKEPSAARSYRASPYAIVVPDRQSEPIALAAVELQHWMKEIGGERPDIVRGTCPAGKKGLFLGRDFLKTDTGKNDSWLITRRGDGIYLTANRDDGVVNAVFDLLEQNTDIVFARSEENDGVVFTATDGITFTNCKSHVVPAFVRRTIGMLGIPYDPATRMCQRRNYCNFVGSYDGRFEQWHTYSIFFPRGLSYGFGEFLPNKVYFEEHPEYYGMKDGLRRPYEHYGVQMCYSNPESQLVIARNLLKELAKDAKVGNEVLNVGYGDTWNLCCCPRCLAPIALPSGRVLKSEDEEFRSEQFYRFAFGVIREVRKTRPDVEFRIGGYLYAAIPPPELKFPPNVSVMFCPYPKRCRVPVYDDTHNGKWHRACEDWAKTGAIMDIYEYYGNAVGFARPYTEIAQKDILYWNRLGFENHFYTEMGPDMRRASAKTYKEDPAGRWDFALMENWVLARILVDPTRDVAALRKDFCRRAYHEAAPLMEKFFGTIRDEWFKDPEVQGWGEDAVRSMNSYVRSKGREKDMRELLVRAERTAHHPNSKSLIRQTLARWDVLAKEANEVQPAPIEIPFKGATFDKTVGSNALFRVWHDNERLYVAVKVAERPVVGKTPGEGEWFPSGSGAGVLIRPGKNLNTYYQFLVTPDGRKYDAKAYDLYWNSPGFTVTAKPAETSWKALLSIPLADVGVNPTVPGETYLQFVADPLQEDAHDAEKFKPYVIETK